MRPKRITFCMYENNVGDVLNVKQHMAYGITFRVDTIFNNDEIMFTHKKELIFWENWAKFIIESVIMEVQIIILTVIYVSRVHDLGTHRIHYFKNSLFPIKWCAIRVSGSSWETQPSNFENFNAELLLGVFRFLRKSQRFVINASLLSLILCLTLSTDLLSVIPVDSIFTYKLYYLKSRQRCVNVNGLVADFCTLNSEVPQCLVLISFII